MGFRIVDFFTCTFYCRKIFCSSPKVYWVILHAFLSFADKFSKSTLFKICFRNTIRVSKSLDPDQARRFVVPNLDLNCLQMLKADDT